MRTVDRLEFFVIALAILAGLFAAACAGALGTAVYEARSSSMYVAESQMHRSATATAAIATAAGKGIETTVNAQRPVGVPQTQSVSRRVDPPMVQDFRSGRRVNAAQSSSHATADAIAIAWFA